MTAVTGNTEYHVVVVGGGAAGCVVAVRLSEDGTRQARPRRPGSWRWSAAADDLASVLARLAADRAAAQLAGQRSVTGDDGRDRQSEPALCLMRQVGPEPARDGLGQGGHDDLVELAIGARLLDGLQRVGAA
jgi:hypothetical protein